MKAFILMATAALLISPAVFSQSQATLTEPTGKVEVKAPGGNWTAAAVGTKVAMGASISTGFSSSALLDLGTSTLRVAPLTRMQLVDLVARQGSVSTSLFLKVGKVHAEVKKVEGLRQSFTLKSPQATAAVRGTEFDFDGLTVNVINGVVQFSTLWASIATCPEGRGARPTEIRLQQRGTSSLTIWSP